MNNTFGRAVAAVPAPANVAAPKAAPINSRLVTRLVGIIGDDFNIH
jgi:hypothetical protein